MDQEARVFWDAVFMRAFESALRSPQPLGIEWIIDASTKMADAALKQRQDRIGAT